MTTLLDGLRAHHRFWLGFAVASVSFAAIVCTIDDPGVTWDEPYSIAASELYVEWYLTPSAWFDAKARSEHWQPNHEHPPLAKTLMGLVRRGYAVLTGTERAVPTSRLSTALFFTALQVGVFLFAAWGFGEAAGLASCCCLLLMPRVFGDAHLASLDVPLACLWLWTALAFARGIESKGWSAAAGVLWGLALLTKFDAVLIPVPLLIWGLACHRDKLARNLIWMAVLGPVVLLAGWPWLWDNTWARLSGYVADKLGRSGGQAWIVPSYYFGRAYVDRYPPWHYPLVITAITVPVGILACAIMGVVRSVRASSKHRLVLISAAFILGLFCLPFVPKYDGVRLFMSAFPFVAVLSGTGLAWAASKLTARVAVPVAVVFFASQSVGIVRMHPCELSYYNLLAGGLPGAQRLGMEPTYWGDSVTWAAFDQLNALVLPGRQVAVAFFPRSEFIDGIYVNDGYLDPDRFRVVPFEGRWDYAILFARRSMIDPKPAARKLWDEATPAWQLQRMGVDLCRIYRRP